MNRPVRMETDPDKTRARILKVAEEHFRRVGYHKTSVPDIASELGMSPANVYRFFPSRGAINESICGRIVNEVTDIAFAIARTNAPAVKKLDQLLTAVHHHNKMTLVREKQPYNASVPRRSLYRTYRNPNVRSPRTGGLNDVGKERSVHIDAEQAHFLLSAMTHVALRAKGACLAATLATRLGLKRQKINYHLLALEEHGLVEIAGTRKWVG
jgi:AcrR family transcriptional regulator